MAGGDNNGLLLSTNCSSVSTFRISQGMCAIRLQEKSSRRSRRRQMPDSTGKTHISITSIHLLIEQDNQGMMHRTLRCVLSDGTKHSPAFPRQTYITPIKSTRLT